jgi:hypothetical protein
MKKSKLLKELAMEQDTTAALRRDLDRTRHSLARVNQENARLKGEQVKVDLEMKSEFEDVTFGPYDSILRINVGNTVTLTITHRSYEYTFEGFRYTLRKPV